MDYLSEILKGFLTVCLVMGCYYYANRRGVESKDSKLMQQGKVIYFFIIFLEQFGKRFYISSPLYLNHC